MSTITITFSESVENHVGNQQIGNKVEKGLSCKELEDIGKKYKEIGFEIEIIDLSNLIDGKEKASLLIVRKYISDTKLFDKLVKLDWDKKAKMRGKVVNKHARHNLCFSDFKQEPDYENGKGRVYDFDEIEELKEIRDELDKKVGMKLNAEGNYYYDVKKCYIGYHGDTERRIVVGLRLGESFPLKYRGYKDGEPISDEMEVMLDGGDLYFMSDKAVGWDWKKRLVPTLRHAAGFCI